MPDKKTTDLTAATTLDGTEALMIVQGGTSVRTTVANMFVQVINTQTASYTLVFNDKNNVVAMNVATANNLTVPLNSAVSFPVGSRIDIIQYGAGQTTVVATGGVTIRSPFTKISGQYCGATLLKYATDEWILVGSLA